MPVINGKFNASVNGIVRVTPDHPFLDSSTTPATVVSQPYTATMTNGTFSIVVPQSQSVSNASSTLITTEGITYLFEILQSVTTNVYYTPDGVVYNGLTHVYTDGFTYTGSVHDATSRRVDTVSSTNLVSIAPAIHAVVPNTTPIDFSTLVAISSASPYLDISLYRLAELLTTNATYLSRISSKLTIRGAYSSTATYNYGDLATYNGNSYVWQNLTSGSGQAPALTGDNTYWLMVAARGAAGGTGAQIVGYSSSAWAGSSEAASRSDVRDGIVSVGTQDLTPYALKSQTAPNASPVFSGNVKRGALTYPFPLTDADKDSEIPTVRFLDNSVAAALVASNLLPKPLVYAQRSANLNLGSNTIIPFDTFPTNQGGVMDNAGNFTPAVSGSYLFYVSACFYVTCDYGSTLTRLAYNLTLNKGTTALGNFLNYDVPASTQITQQIPAFRFQQTLNAGDSFNISAGVSVFQASGSSQNVSIQSRQLVNGVSSNFLLIWRVSS